MSAITGRQVYHWHTRTKTRKAPELGGALIGRRRGESNRPPRQDVGSGERGNITPPGVVFVLFHYGDPNQEAAANLLTPRISDPAFKQPVQKLAAVRPRQNAQALVSGRFTELANGKSGLSNYPTQLTVGLVRTGEPSRTNLQKPGLFGA